jgi:hypothetical protein
MAAAVMMIDTLKVSRRLRDAGASEAMADALAATLAEAGDAGRAELATKVDLDQLRTEFKADVETRILATENRILAAQNRMLVWIAGMLIAAVGLTVTLLRTA